MGMVTSSAHLQRWVEAVFRPFSSSTFSYTDRQGVEQTAYGMVTSYIDDSLVVSFGEREVHEHLLCMPSSMRSSIRGIKCASVQGRRQFRIPEAYQEELNKTIQELLQYNLIEPSMRKVAMR